MRHQPIKNGTIRSIDVKNGTIRLRDLTPGARAWLIAHAGKAGKAGANGVDGKDGVDGVAYSSVHQINPNYGHDNGDGTSTVSAIATSLNDNSARQNPNGSITRASLIYEGTGSIEFSNVVINGQPISFT